MSLKNDVLTKLRDSRSFISGQELSEACGVSRTAVWKAVNRLREEGYGIEAVPNRGYRLADPTGLDLYNAAELERALAVTSWAGHPAVFREETGSTNLDVMALADKGRETAPEGLLVCAAKQNAGKGRRGRVWISPPEGNIYMSILLRPAVPANRAPMVTLVAAMAVCSALKELAGRKAEFAVKWPNDIVARRKAGVMPAGDRRPGEAPDSVPEPVPGPEDGSRDTGWKKVVGILTEMRLEETRVRDVTIGIGINVNMSDIPEELRGTASSVLLMTGEITNRAALTAAVWKAFEDYYGRYLTDGSLEGLRSGYEKMLVNLGRKVRVLDPAEPFCGVARGISSFGSLLVTREDGTEVSVSAGEVSVRGVEGYV